MRLVGPDQQIYPQASPSGEQGLLLDTHWDIHYPGPGRVYLSEADIQTIIGADDVLQLALVREVLEARGWHSPESHAELVKEFNVRLDNAKGALADALAEADGLRMSIARQISAAEAGTVVPREPREVTV